MVALTRLRAMLALSATGLGFVNCGVTDSPVGSQLGAIQGQSCDSEGRASEASDGCNTCTCIGARWNCTSHACDEPCTAGAAELGPDGCNSCACGEDGQWLCTQVACEPCQNGDLRPVGDGCNTCTCNDGLWSCTTEPCEGCPPPRAPADCAPAEVVAMDQMTGACCRYAMPCAVPDGMLMFDDEASCAMQGAGGATGMPGMGTGGRGM